MHPCNFRPLTDAEVEKFKQSARDDYIIGSPIEPIWHPVYALECAKMNYEMYLLTQKALGHAM